MEINENRCIQITDQGELDSLFKVIELWRKSAVITGFNEETGKWEVLAGENREAKDIQEFIDPEDSDSIRFEIFDRLQECQKIDFKKVKIEQITLLRAYGSPSCYITIPPGPPIRIC